MLSQNQRKLRIATLCKSQNLLIHNMLLPEDVHETVLQQPAVPRRWGGPSRPPPPPSPSRGRTDMLNRQTCPPPSWRRDLSLPILLCTITCWCSFQQPPIAVLDKLGGFTKSHFSVNCSTWVGNVPEHRPRAKLLVVYSYRLVVFYTTLSNAAAPEHRLEQFFFLHSLSDSSCSTPLLQKPPN